MKPVKLSENIIVSPSYLAERFIRRRWFGKKEFWEIWRRAEIVQLPSGKPNSIWEVKTQEDCEVVMTALEETLAALAASTDLSTQKVTKPKGD